MTGMHCCHGWNRRRGGTSPMNVAPKSLAHPSPACLVKVGGGRGFIIEYRRRIPRDTVPRLAGMQLRSFVTERLIVTAAHCLPKFPPPHSFSDWDRTYKNLVATLDGSKKGIWVQCIFCDPVADVAILDCPDDQELYEQADTYRSVIDESPALRMGKVQEGMSRGWLLTLENQWAETRMNVFTGLHGISLCTGLTKAGMSGSPVLNDAGQAVGIVATGGGQAPEEVNDGPQPILSESLPGWLARKFC